ncbi:MAG: hypothetical protein Q4A00_07745 [Flavobacteriaceae bacterium]|nr:hypothetical protein [Flavobacteriaceae bacterium]
MKNGQSVTLDVCIDEKERAKLNSGISYISLNARGKMLEDFENAKSLLEKIEIKLGGKEGFFSEQYDRKYLDVFYKSVDSSKKLEDKAKEINQKSVSFLLNSYNLVCNVFGENTSRNYVKNFDDYYKNLNDFYKKYERNEEDCGIMKIYFSFIHKVLTEMHNITGVDEWACLNHIWKDEKKGLFNTCEKEEQDSECTVIYLLYLYFNENVSIESLRKLEYVLNNISYDSVRQSNFDFARYICERLVKDDIYEYFVKVVNIQDSIKEIKWKNKNNDLKCKIKEQIIKFQMIDCYNKDAYEPKKEFKAYEDKNGRQLYYLLLITDLWSGEVTKEKINLLDTYLTRYQNSLFLSDLLMKKWFAFATYYDDEKDELLSAQEINERCNYRYFRNEGESKIQLSTKNLHKLEWNLYYTDDEIEYGSDIKTKELKKIKLFIIKKMYDFLLELNTKEKIHEWLKSKFKESYNQCWLKYAVDRGYSELLDNQLRYNNGNVEILIKDEEREESWVRFDARVLLLDLKENRGLEQYDKFVWSYDTKHVKDSKLEIGLPYKECINQKFYNHFPVPIFNLLYEEKYLEGRRCFFYLMDRVNLVFPNNIVYSIENEEIKLYQFYSNYKYEIFSYSLSGDFKRLEDEQKDFEKKVANLPKRFQDFEKNSNNWEKDYYSYLDGIYKFRKKPIIEKKIEMKNFQKKGENNLYDLGFRHEVFSTRG